MPQAGKFDPYALLAQLRLEDERDANQANCANLGTTISTISANSTRQPTQSEITARPADAAKKPASPSSRMLRAEGRKTAVSGGKEPILPGSRKSDVEVYADALRLHGPSGYGGLAAVLGWGVGRASLAEIELRKTGRIIYPDKTGRGCLAGEGEPE